MANFWPSEGTGGWLFAPRLTAMVGAPRRPLTRASLAFWHGANRISRRQHSVVLTCIIRYDVLTTTILYLPFAVCILNPVCRHTDSCVCMPVMSLPTWYANTYFSSPGSDLPCIPCKTGKVTYSSCMKHGSSIILHYSYMLMILSCLFIHGMIFVWYYIYSICIHIQYVDIICMLSLLLLTNISYIYVWYSCDENIERMLWWYSWLF